MSAPLSVSPRAPLAQVAYENEDELELVGDAAEDEEEHPGGRRLLGSVAYFVCMAVLGAGLVAGWRTLGPGLDLKLPTSWRPSFAWASVPAFLTTSAVAPATPVTATTTASTSDNQVTRLTAEIEGLKKSLAEMHGAQQQAAATIASLQTAQGASAAAQAALRKELEARIASEQSSRYWYANSAALAYRPLPRPRTAAATRPQPAPARPAEAGAGAPRGGVLPPPVSLTRP